MSMVATAISPRGLKTLIQTEARLFLRDPASVFFALVFPTVVLAGIGLAIPGMRETITDQPEPWNGLAVIHVFAPIALATAAATVALITLPVHLCTYREQGVLRRLSTTPMRPQGVLVAHVVINVAALILAAAIAFTVATAVFSTPVPNQPGLAVLGFVLGAAAMFGIGLLIAALAPKGNAASAIGNLLLFPMLFFAGMWTPGPAMPETLQTISAYTPLGAATQVMTAAWFEPDIPVLQLIVLVAYVAVLYPLAARLFRWQ